MAGPGPDNAMRLPIRRIVSFSPHVGRGWMLAVASLAVVAWARQACGAEDGGADDDNLCSVLARRNFGWVRVLDLTEPPPVERVDPVAHEELPGLPFGRRSLFRPTAWRRN